MVFLTGFLRWSSWSVLGSLRKSGIALLVLLLLASCAGGGGGSSSPGVPGNSPPSSSPDVPEGLTSEPALTGLSFSQPGSTEISPFIPAQDVLQTLNSQVTSEQDPTPRLLLYENRFNPLVILTWAPIGIDPDRILRYEYRVDGGPWMMAPGTKRSLVVDNLVDGQTYHFQVRAEIDGGSPVISDVVPVPPHAPSTADPQPDQPLNLQARGGVGRILLTWDAPVPKTIPDVPEAREHILFYLYRETGGEWRNTDSPSAHLVEGLVNNRTYTFWILPVSQHGIGEPVSASATTTASHSAPDAPTALTATLDGQWTDLTWHAPLWDGGANITSYQYQVNGGAWQTLQTYTESADQCPYRCRVLGSVQGLTSGDRSRVRAVNQVGGGAQSNEAPVSGLPRLSVSDAFAREGVNAAIEFVVSLQPAATGAVTVEVATANGTAQSGTDYQALSTTVRFAAGETAKTVSVSMLDDGVDEGVEIFTLSLSNATGALILDAQAIGTIVNADPVPAAWVSRFGRMVGLQALDAIEARVRGANATRVQAGAMAQEVLHTLMDAQGAQQAPSQPGLRDFEGSQSGHRASTISGPALLAGSAFQYSAGEAGGLPEWTVWGRLATGGFEAKESGVALDGDVSTGFLGADLSHAGWLAGVALGVSEGEGEYDPRGGADRGKLESRLTSVYPYARLELGERMEVWGLVGYGRGELELTTHAGLKSDLEMLMGALGVQSDLDSDTLDLAVKSDALWVRTESDAQYTKDAGRLAASRGEVSRIRLILAGSRTFALDPGKTLIPSVEIGVRHDGGDADTGTGLEAEAVLRYVAGPLTAEAGIHGLIVHEESDYEEWGASGTVQLAPDTSGRGLSLRATSAWGVALGEAERLWSANHAGDVIEHNSLESRAQMEATIGYGIGLSGTRGVLTPFASHALSSMGARTNRIGGQWRTGSGFALDIEGRRRGEDSHEGPDHAVILRASLQW